MLPNLCMEPMAHLLVDSRVASRGGGGSCATLKADLQSVGD